MTAIFDASGNGTWAMSTAASPYSEFTVVSISGGFILDGDDDDPPEPFCAWHPSMGPQPPPPPRHLHAVRDPDA